MKFKINCPCKNYECNDKNTNYNFVCNYEAYIELDNSDVVTLECENNNKKEIILYSAEFQILFDLGVKAYIDDYYKEAVSDFASSLERFFEYFIFTIMLNDGIEENEIEKFWKNICNQSERQLGAFYNLYLYKFREYIGLEKKFVEFRNKVIHKGYIPNKLETMEYMKYIYYFIVNIINKMYCLYKRDENDFEKITEKLYKYIEYRIRRIKNKKQVRKIYKSSWVNIIDLEVFDDEAFSDENINFENKFNNILQNGFETARG